MEALNKYIKKNYKINDETLDDLIEDFPEIKNIVEYYNKDLAKICKAIDDLQGPSDKTKIEIKKAFAYLTNIISDADTYKYAYNTAIQDLLSQNELINNLNATITKLKEHANRTEEGRLVVQNSEKELNNAMKIIVETTTNKPLSKHREYNLKKSLSLHKEARKIYLKEDLKNVDGMKNKKLNDIKAVAITDN